MGYPSSKLQWLMVAPDTPWRGRQHPGAWQTQVLLASEGLAALCGCTSTLLSHLGGKPNYRAPRDTKAPTYHMQPGKAADSEKYAKDRLTN